MSLFELTPKAERDVENIWDYLAADSIEGADRVLGALESAFQLIGTNPAIGHKRHDLTKKAVLFWPVGKYLVIYRERDSRVEIFAVVHGARDIPKVLRIREIAAGA